MSRREDRIERMRAVEREYLAAVEAIDLLAKALQADPAYLSSRDLRARDFQSLKKNLEATYLIRLYAEFESGLRDAWRNAFHQTSHPPMRDLLSAFAARRDIPQAWCDAVVAVREYRNSLVHEEREQAEAVPLNRSRSHLLRFFSFLPLDW